MKRLLLVLLPTMLLASVALIAPSALARWSETTHAFGRIPQHKPVTARFAVTNEGAVPLLINRAKGSCGCTGVTFTKTPILPGQSGEVTATFNAAAPGAFSKTVTVESNAADGVQTLRFTGEVIPAPAR
ncbi:DUF1573 domain-containing protein [Spirosoma luteolum]